MNKPIIITVFATLFLVVALTLYFLQGCRRDVEPIDDPFYNDFQQKVIALHFRDENGNSLQGISVQIKKDDQSPETLLKDGSITYPVSEEGNYTFTLSKEGYIGCEHRVVVEFDCDVCGWFYEEELILTKINSSFVVESNIDKTYSIDSKTSVYSPKDVFSQHQREYYRSSYAPVAGKSKKKKGVFRCVPFILPPKPPRSTSPLPSAFRSITCKWSLKSKRLCISGM